MIHCSTYTHVHGVLYWAPEKYKEVLALPSLALGLFLDLYMMFFGRPLRETPCILHTSNLSFLLHGQNFWRIKFTPKNANFSR